MLNAQQQRQAALSDQVAFWNDWNGAHREAGLADVSCDQARVVTSWLSTLGRRDLDIIEVGCGTGWMCGELQDFGRVTATDLSDQVLARARLRVPEARFVAGDFMDLDFGTNAYDVAVSLEVLSHVADQPAFLAKIASHLKPGGLLMLATQNRPQLQRNDIPPPQPGQIRQWVDRHDLTALLQPEFHVEQLFSVTPRFNRGYLRYVNSRKARSLLTSVGLGATVGRLKRLQENAWMGWTLMALARKR